MIQILIVIIGLLCIYKQYQIIKLNEKIDILTSENISLKQVMAAEGLIPKEYVK